MPVLKTATHSLSKAIILLCGFVCLSMQTVINREYQVKAVFLFNFTQFVEWPANTFTGPETPIVIGVLGKNPFGTYLDETVLNEKVNNRTLLIHYYNSPEEVKNCQILFINLRETKKLEQTLLALKGKNILTVSDQNSFLNQGGMIRFFTKNNKIQFQINPEAAKAAELNVSSKLLRLAEIVVPEKK
jgi:hypothetical protein